MPIFLNNDEPINDVPPIEYLKENEVASDTTLDSIYSAVDLRINEESFVITAPRIVQDSVSGDTLYYRATIDSRMVFPYGDIFFVTNPNYVLYDNEAVSEYNCKWGNYNTMYKVLSNESIDIPSVQVKGCLEYKQLRFYFTYTDIVLSEPITPTTFLDSLFII